jgi:hypothetical protein
MKDEKIAMTNNYVVTLEATSYKEVPVSAASEEAALELAHEMYFNSGVLNSAMMMLSSHAAQMLHANEIRDGENHEPL